MKTPVTDAISAAGLLTELGEKMVYRIYVEKKPGFRHEANSLFHDVTELLGIKSLRSLRVINRYDVEGIDRGLFEYSVGTVFSEPQTDTASETLDFSGYTAVASEYLPGQFDQRADSASQCIQIISQGERPLVRTARIYLLEGDLDPEDVGRFKKYVINPVESREASLDAFDTLRMEYPVPDDVPVLVGFCELDEDGLKRFLADRALAMDLDDLKFCRDYFRTERRDPTLTEIRMIDTYWSDHCRHTTFLTSIDSVRFEDSLLQSAYDEYIAVRRELGRTKPVNLMDLATICTRYLKAKGQLPLLDESEEINACTVKIRIDVDGKPEDWLLLFKNETHNHPTEIEPFGGAATCIGGAIRDPLSGRAYVYGAMRVTGAGDPLADIADTIPGKLPQRRIVTTAADGYSSYGNQIGLATGIVDELYHPGYTAKRMEIGAVIGAVPAEHVRRETPQPGDKVILLGGRTGRDGCGGATGSSKSHTVESLETCGAEVQKGNAPEERKLQRLFRNPEASRLIRRCNDFGAGGVSVAIGELADGLHIDLNKVPKKYEGLDGTELAISESQERMAVVTAAKDAAAFMKLADAENLESTVVAEVTEEKRLVMELDGVKVVDISREFLDTNGAKRFADAKIAAPVWNDEKSTLSVKERMEALVSDLNVCSQKGLSERFDSTIGANTVLMPFGGKRQLTPSQAMACKLPVLNGETDTCSVMAWGYDPYVSSVSPYNGSQEAVITAVAKVIAAGGDHKHCWMSFQEFFGHTSSDPLRWGSPMSALLGALKAQMNLGIAAIGGKDSMSGTFEDLDVPPTLISFAVSTADANKVVSDEFKGEGHHVYLIRPSYDENHEPDYETVLDCFDRVKELIAEEKAMSVWTLERGGAAEGIFKMMLGNAIGFELDEGIDTDQLFGRCAGAFLVETAEKLPEPFEHIGMTTEDYVLKLGDTVLDMKELEKAYEGKLASVFPYFDDKEQEKPEKISYRTDEKLHASYRVERPHVLIPVFPGTNCEWDTARAFEKYGAEAEIFIIRNRTSEEIAESAEKFAAAIRKSQIIMIPGGFSGGDEPEGSGKFITAFFRNPMIKEAVEDLLDNREGLMCGICNGFQALIKLGLVPYGKIIDTDEDCPTLTFNTIGRHQSMIVRTRVASNKSPWLRYADTGEIHTVAISHGEGRFVAPESVIRELIENGQVAEQYVGLDNEPTMDLRFNPNGSYYAIEGITSKDGRIFGKMGHSERSGKNLYRNIPGQNPQDLIFKGAVDYFR